MRYLVVLGLLLAFLILGYDIRVIVVAGGFNYRLLLTVAVILFGFGLLDLYWRQR